MDYPSLFLRVSTLSMASLYIAAYVHVLSGTQWTIPTSILVLVEHIYSFVSVVLMKCKLYVVHTLALKYKALTHVQT